MSIALVLRPEFSTAKQIPILLKRAEKEKELGREDCNVVIVTDECGEIALLGELTRTAKTLQGLAGVKSVQQSEIRSGCYELNITLEGERNPRKLEVIQVERLFGVDDMTASKELLTIASNLDVEKDVRAVINGSEYCTKATADVAAALNQRRQEYAAGGDYVKLPANPVDAVLAFRSKRALSELVKAARYRLEQEDKAEGTDRAISCGLHEVNCHRINSLDDLSDDGIPAWLTELLAEGRELIFKPDNKAGSLAVHKVSNLDELRAYYEHYTSAEHRVDEGGFVATTFLVQPYINARNTTGHVDAAGTPEYDPEQGEFSIEGFVNDGKVNVLTITRTLIDGMLEEGHLSQADISDQLEQSITRSISELIKQGGLTSGVFHIECRVNSYLDESGTLRHCVYPIDAALRPPGCTLDLMVKTQTSRDMNDLMVATAFGDAVAPSYRFRQKLVPKVSGRYFPKATEPFREIRVGSFAELPGVSCTSTFWKKPGEPIQRGTFDERIGAVCIEAVAQDSDWVVGGVDQAPGAVLRSLQYRVYAAIEHARHNITTVPLSVGEEVVDRGVAQGDSSPDDEVRAILSVPSAAEVAFDSPSSSRSRSSSSSPASTRSPVADLPSSSPERGGIRRTLSAPVNPYRPTICGRRVSLPAVDELKVYEKRLSGHRQYADMDTVEECPAGNMQLFMVVLREFFRMIADAMGANAPKYRSLDPHAKHAPRPQRAY